MFKIRYLFLISLVLMLLSACSSIQQTFDGKQKGFTVLAINDVYRLDNLAKVRTLRKQLEKNGDVLVLHAGDFLFPSFLSRKYNGEQMIDVLNVLDGDDIAKDPLFFITPGNHEFDKSKMKHAPIVRDRLAESQFDWLASNIQFKTAANIQGENLLPSKLIEVNGINVGIFGLTTDTKKAEYIQRFLDPVTVAKNMTAQLRQQGAEIVIALTHLDMQEDKHILQTLGKQGPDIIFGGHEHNRQSADVQGRYVIKADADAITATVAQIQLKENAVPSVNFTFKNMQDVPADPMINTRIDGWIKKHEQAFCQADELGAGCLSKRIGKTRVLLKAEELEIRRFETNIGNWIADTARDAYADRGAQIAFLNAGGLRLNQDIPAGADLTKRTLNQLFAYPSPIALVKMKGSTLQQVVDRSIQKWTGNGHWLQISGFAFRHNPETQVADQLTLLDKNGARPVKPDEDILAVINYYLLDPKGDQDGYMMLSPALIINPDDNWPDLKNRVESKLKATEQQGISPQIEGRVCNTQRGGRCLAVGQSDL
jgi:2',3'-cyclic-nucleotide 2'-phosphodiesterase (5'-nucleotidase family)